MATELMQRKYTMLLPSSGLHHKLLGWFDQAKRAMPWRQTRDPYAIWLSETMLQQTQVETVKPYYHKFLERFPTVADLAGADLEEVLAMWAGLGYYRRAKHLHLAAKEMVTKHQGEVPKTFEGLVSLPGVGRYTAGAVGSIAFGLPTAVVDGNVMRVISRLTAFDGEISEKESAAFFWRVMEEILAGARGAPAGKEAVGPSSLATPDVDAVPSDAPSTPQNSMISTPRYGDINQAVMELGATVCTPPPSVPACLVCPVREWCRACAEGRQLDLPVKKRKGETPVVRGVAVVVVRENAKRNREGSGRHEGKEVLLMKRPMGGVWEGMWEFPVVAGENMKRETRNAQQPDAQEWVRDVLGFEVKNVLRCGEVRHQLTHRLMAFDVVRVEAIGETQNGKNDGEERTKDDDVLLPGSVTAGEKRYVEARWVGWPLVRGGKLPLSKVVWKVAEAAASGE